VASDDREALKPEAQANRSPDAFDV